MVTFCFYFFVCHKSRTIEILKEIKAKQNNQWPRQESNLDLELRKLLYYPLYYEAIERRLFQVAIPSVILSGIGLFTEILNIGTKNLYRNGEQYYAEKFS